MAYNPNIPIGTDAMLKSQSQIRANFQQLNSAFAENHEGLTSDASISGMHNLLLFREQTGDPTTSPTQSAMYTKQVSNTANVFFRPNNNQTPIQLTYQSLNTGPNLSKQYSYVAGPFIIFGGIILAASQGQVVTLTPTTTLLYCGLTEVNRPSLPPFAGPAIGVVSGSSFTIQFANGPPKPNLFYFAIGKP